MEAAVTKPAAATAEELTRVTFECFFTFVEEHPYAWRMLFRDVPADPEIATAHRRVLREGTDSIATLYSRIPALDLSADIPRDRADAMLAKLTQSALDGLAHDVALWEGGTQLAPSYRVVPDVGRTSPSTAGK